MPNCPMCGKEVQAATVYCPACGTNLKQGSASSPGQLGAYSPSYSYSQQGMGMPEQSKPHGHKKYIIAIVAALLIGLVVGGLITNFFLIGPDVTDVTGTVALSAQITNQYHGTPSQILFGSADTGNLSSAVFQDHSYQAYLPIGETYTVIIQWTNITGTSTVSTYGCAAVPHLFSSSGSNASQSFSC